MRVLLADVADFFVGKSCGMLRVVVAAHAFCMEPMFCSRTGEWIILQSYTHTYVYIHTHTMHAFNFVLFPEIHHRTHTVSQDIVILEYVKLFWKCSRAILAIAESFHLDGKHQLAP